MKKLISILFILLISLFFINNLSAFTITYHIANNGGISSGCQNPDYQSITDAIIDIKNNQILSANLIVCEGTYIENIALADMENISIIGENNNVLINSENIIHPALILARTKGINIKNLNLSPNSNVGLEITDSENIVIEDVVIEDIKNQNPFNDPISGIFINNSENITLKGNILIKNIRRLNKVINGIDVRFSKDIFIEDGLLEINDIKSTSNEDDSIINGIKIFHSNININSDILLTEIYGKKIVNGIFADYNSTINISDIGSININYLDSELIVKGININNNSVLTSTKILNISNIGFENADTYGIYAKDGSIGSFNEINLSKIKGKNNTYGLYLENTPFLISGIKLNENKTSNLVRLIEINNSEGIINNIINDKEIITLNTNNFRLININNSKISITNMDVTSSMSIPNCIYVENNSKIDLDNINLEKCSNNRIINKDSEINIIESDTLDLDKLYIEPSQSASIKVYKNIKLNFYNKDNQKIELDSIIAYNNEDPGKKEDVFNNNHSFYVLYYLKESRNNNISSKIINNQSIIGIKSRINERPVGYTIDNLNFEEKDIIFESIPDEFIEMSANINNIKKTVNNFSIIKVSCSTELDKSYGCYEISKSQSLLNGNNYQLKFKISSNWFVLEEVNPDNLKLYHYENGKYVELNTTKLNFENNNYIFSSKINSFSEFQIAEKNESDSIDDDTNTDDPITIDPIDENITDPVNDDCNISCYDYETLDIINCICVPNMTVCELECEDTEYLDTENCVCVDISDRDKCNIRCGPGQTTDLENCRCIQITHDGVKYSNSFYSFLIFTFLIIVIIVLLIIILNKKKIKKKENKRVKKK